ncbi:MAG TPA: SLC13 family permease [Gemmatimonadaceae bacterium]|nr:SLC13 family permease [Gemmatimonadaceae bacterium]
MAFRLLLLVEASGRSGLASGTDPVSQALVAAILIVVFFLLAREAAHRVVISLAAVAAIWLITYLTPFHLLSFERTAAAVDFNVLVLLAAMMALVGVIRTTGVFEWAVARVLRSANGRPAVVLVLLVWATAFLSAFLDNVTTMVFVTPIAVQLARRMRVAVATFLLPAVMASNIGGTATLIGDPPNIMIGSGADLSFADFIARLTLPCLLMVALLSSFAVFRARRELADSLAPATPAIADIPELSDPELARWMGWIGALVLLGFLTHHISGMPAAVPATVGAALALVVQDRLYLKRHRPTPAERIHGVLAVTERDIEWPTLAFFACLFVVVGAALETGLIETLARGLVSFVDGSAAAFALRPRTALYFAALVICWTSGAVSAVVDNIPFVAVSIPVIGKLAQTMQGDTTVLWWALALGACLGGNATVVGASANVTAVGLAERAGVRLRFADFARYGIPVTIGTLLVSSLVLAGFVYLSPALTQLLVVVAFVPLFAVAALLRRMR